MKYIKILLIFMIVITALSCSKKSTQTDETTVKKPVFLLPSGEYEEGQYIAIRCDTEEAEIRYTFDNSEPLLSSAVYTQELRIPDFFINNSNTCIVKARAFKTGFLPSAIATATYSLNYENTVATPTLSPAGGTQSSNINAVISCLTPNAVIRYTTDGTEPDYYSTVYSAPIPVKKPQTIKAKAFKSGMNASSVVTTAYDLLLYEIGFLDTPGDAWDVAIRGNYAYIADREGGFRIVDVSDPEQPVQVGYYLIPYYAKKVLVNGSYAYVAAGSGFHIFDISDPANPEEVSYRSAASIVIDIAINGNIIYVSCGTTGIMVYDVSNPASAILVGSYDTPGLAFGLEYSNNHLFIADGYSGLRIVNVSNPGSIYFVSMFSLNAIDVKVRDNYAYVLDIANTLKILNIASLSSPQQISVIAVYSAGDLCIEGNYVYIASGETGIKVIDITNPSSPLNFAQFDTPGEAYSVKVAGNYVYVGDYAEGLRILYCNTE